jgi:hypothetical protein
MLQTKSEILANLWNDSMMSDMLSKFNAGGGAEDLKSELFAVLCEKDEAKLQQMAAAGQLMFYATGIVQRMIFQKNSKFHRMFRGCVYDLMETKVQSIEDESAKEKELILQKLEKGIENLHWAEQAILEIYQKEGNLVSISRKTNISYKQVHKMMDNAKTKLVSEVSGKIFGNYIVATMGIVIDCEDEVNPDNIIEILEDTLYYLKKQAEGRRVPCKTEHKSFIKELQPIRVSKII